MDWPVPKMGTVIMEGFELIQKVQERKMHLGKSEALGPGGEGVGLLSQVDRDKVESGGGGMATPG